MMGASLMLNTISDAPLFLRDAERRCSTSPTSDSYQANPQFNDRHLKEETVMLKRTRLLLIAVLIAAALGACAPAATPTAVPPAPTTAPAAPQPTNTPVPPVATATTAAPAATTVAT